MPTHRTVKLDELSQYFHLPEKAVAKELGVCLTSLKKICRQNGISRWPYRKLKSLDKKLVKIETALTNPSVSDDQNSMLLKYEMLKNEKKNLPFQGSADDSEAETTRRTSPPVANTGRQSASSLSHVSSARVDHGRAAPSPLAGSRSLLSQRLRQVGSVDSHRRSLAESSGNGASKPAAMPSPFKPAPLKASRLLSPMAPPISSPQIPLSDDSADVLRSHLEVDVTAMPLSSALLSGDHATNANRLADYYARDSARDHSLEIDSARLSARGNSENPFTSMDSALGDLYPEGKGEASMYDEFMLLSNA